MKLLQLTPYTWFTDKTNSCGVAFHIDLTQKSGFDVCPHQVDQIFK